MSLPKATDCLSNLPSSRKQDTLIRRKVRKTKTMMRVQRQSTVLKSKGGKKLDVALQRFYSENANMIRNISWDLSSSLSVDIGSSHTQGARAYMEDRHFIQTTSFGCVCAIFDGHNGAWASHHAQTRLQELLSNPLEKLRRLEDVPAILNSALVQLENEILQKTMKSGRTDGTTAIVAVIWRRVLFLANVGDCRAVMGQASSSCRLTTDHKPDEPDEKARIEGVGGEVVHSGVWRVAHEGVNVRLAISRSLGDHPLKCNLPASCSGPLVSSEAAITIHPLTKEDRVLVLGSDGVWDRVEDQEAVDIVDSESTACTAAIKLVEMALKKRSMDNVTAVVLNFQWKDDV